MALDKLGADRVCFGSDVPFAPMHVQLAMFRAIVQDMSEEDQAKILGGNILKVLGG